MPTLAAFDALTKTSLIIVCLTVATASAMAIHASDKTHRGPPIECPPSCNCTIDDEGGAWLSCNNATGIAATQLTSPSLLSLAPGSGDTDTMQQSGISDLGDIDADGNQTASGDGKVEHLRMTMSLSVKSLSVAHNSIAHLSNDTLAYLFNLRHLDLSHNALTSIDSGAFTHLSVSLRSLLLHHNPLMSLAAGVFWHLTNLRVLDLSHCALHRLDDDTFRDLVALQHLNLSGNSFCHVTAQLFLPLTGLSTLNLARNPIMRVESSAFSRLRHLTALNLSQTGLHTLPDSLFDAMDSLEVLDLSHNALVSIRLPAWRRNNSLLLALGDSKMAAGGDRAMDVILTNSTQQSPPIGQQEPTNHNDNCSHVHAIHILGSDNEQLNGSGDEDNDSVPIIKDNSIASPGGEGEENDANHLPQAAASHQHDKQGQGKEESHEEVMSIEDLGYDSRLPYDPQMGWMTAAVLGMVLLGFIVAIIVDKVRHRKRKRSMQRLRFDDGEHLHQFSASPARSHPHEVEYDDEDDVTDDGESDDTGAVAAGDTSSYCELEAVTVTSPYHQHQAANADTSLRGRRVSDSEDNSDNESHEADDDVLPAARADGEGGGGGAGGGVLIVMEGGRRYRVVKVHPQCPLHGHPAVTGSSRSRTHLPAISSPLHTVVEVYPAPSTHSDVITDDIIPANV